MKLVGWYCEAILLGSTLLRGNSPKEFEYNASIVGWLAMLAKKWRPRKTTRLNRAITACALYATRTDVELQTALKRKAVESSFIYKQKAIVPGRLARKLVPTVSMLYLQDDSHVKTRLRDKVFSVFKVWNR